MTLEEAIGIVTDCDKHTPVEFGEAVCVLLKAAERLLEIENKHNEHKEGNE